MSEPGLELRLAAVPAQLLAPGAPALELAAPDAALLAYLALEGAAPRERIAAWLWPTSSAEAARNALRQRLYRLRKLAGHELIAGTAVLALADGLCHDLADAATLLGALRLPEHPELDAWLEQRRAERAGWQRREVEQRIEGLEAAGDAAAALPLALALLQQQPLSEDAHRRVMRLHYLRGDRAAALLAFDACERVLKDEVGAPPAAETLALLAVIEAAGAAVAQDAAPTRRAAQVPVALLRPPRLIGRDLERSTLQQAAASGAVALVIGEAGMGKSRLLQTLAAAGSDWVLTAGRPGDALVPYATLARLLKELAERWPSAFDLTLRQRLAPLLPSLAPEASGRARRGSLQAPMADALQRLRGEFGGLVLDDLHFADPASLDLLQALLAAPRASATPALRWCLGLRPPESGSAQQALVDTLAASGPLVELRLLPLDTAAIGQLIDSLLLPGVRGEVIAPLLRQRSGGNPLFALETLKRAWADGSLQTLDGAAWLTPQSLAQLIGQQLARLSPAGLMLARLAAIAGADFDLLLAEQVLQQSALQLADAWHELETRQVLVGTTFAHDLIFEAVLAGVPAVIARHLHAQVARCLEAGSSEPARVAAHWEAAGQRERALPGLRAAAERAHAALRETEHIAFLLRAADIAEAAGRRAEAFDSVAQAVDSHMNTIRHASGYPLLDRLDGLADTPLQQAAALGRRAWYSVQLADQQTAISAGQRALAFVESLAEPRLEAMIRQRLASALGMAGRFDEALSQLQTAAPAMAAEGSAGDRSEYHGNYAVLLDNLARPQEAAAQRQLAIAAARDAGDVSNQVSQLANHAVSRMTAGDLTEADDAVEQARRLIASYEMQGSTVGFVAVLRLQICRAACRYAEALSAADEARRVLGKSNPARLPVVALHEAHCWLDLGQLPRAREQLQACADALPAHFEARRQLLWARLLVRLGQDPTPHLDSAAAAAPARGWPEVALLVRLQRSVAADELSRLQAEALQLGLGGVVRMAQLRQLQLQLDQQASLDDAAPARELLQQAEREVPAFGYRPELPWTVARALAAAGAVDEAQRLRQLTRRQVSEAAQQLPAALRDGFLQRNPVNQALFAERW